MSHWERTNGEEVIPPISPELDEDLMAMRLGKELGVPAVDVMNLPAHWLGSAMLALEWQNYESEKANNRSLRSMKAAEAARNRRARST